MSKNIKENESASFSLPEVLTVMVICIIFGLLIGGFVVNNRNYNAENYPKIDFNEITGLYDDIKANYYGEYNDNSMRDNTVLGILSSLNDPHAKLITGELANTYVEDLESEYVGIGVTLSKENDDYPKVSFIYDLSPASKKDIKIDDYLIKIGKDDVKEKTLTDIYALLKGGTRGDKIKITTRRIIEEEPKDQEFEISKEIITIPSVSVNYIQKDDKKIAEVIITTFSKNTYKEFNNIYKDIKKEKCDGLIIDIRDNGGGYLSSASSITSLFLEKDKVIYISKKKDKEEKIKSTNDKVINLKTVLLVNEGTASGSEVLATSLKENIDVKIVGTETYGKNTLQKIHRLKDNAVVKFTIGEWLTSKGNSISEIKLVPDIVVKNSNGVKNNSENDKQLIEALKLF